MNSEPVGPTPDEALNALLAPVLGFAQEMLGKAGEFYPFGAVLTADGEVRLEGAYDGSEHPQSTDLISILTEAMQKSAESGEIRAAAICYDVLIHERDGGGDATDAVCVAFEHKGADPLKVLLPYHVNRGLMGRKVTYGSLEYRRGEPSVFRPAADGWRVHD